MLVGISESELLSRYLSAATNHQCNDGIDTNLDERATYSSSSNGYSAVKLDTLLPMRFLHPSFEARREAAEVG